MNFVFLLQHYNIYFANPRKSTIYFSCIIVWIKCILTDQQQDKMNNFLHLCLKHSTGYIYISRIYGFTKLHCQSFQVVNHLVYQGDTGCHGKYGN